MLEALRSDNREGPVRRLVVDWLLNCPTKNEGILPALESSHAVFRAMEQARQMKKEQHILICLSGRGDKDAAEIARLRATIKSNSTP